MDIVVDSPGGVIGPRGMEAAVVRVLADAFCRGAEPEHLKFLEAMDQPLLLDGPAYRDEMARTPDERALRRLNLPA
jgi:hypothetical protein